MRLLHLTAIILHLILLCSAQGCYDESRPNLTSLASQGRFVLTSPGFPSACCQPMNCTWTISHSAYLKIAFFDLDLHPNTILRIYDSSGRLFPEQPQPMSKFTWTRPQYQTTDSQGSVRVEWVTPNATAVYAGFKMVFYATDDTDSEETHTSELCGSLALGRETAVKTVTYEMMRNKHYDCVWVARPNLQEYPNVEVFVRPVRFNFSGSFEVRGNVTSKGPLLFRARLGDHKMNSFTPEQQRWGIQSAQGLFVRLRMDAFFVKNMVVLSSGVYRRSDTTMDEAGCKFSSGGQWFACGSDKAATEHCLPPGYKCNHYNNCLSARDESLDVCPQFRTTVAPPVTPPTTMRTTTTTTTRRPYTRRPICRSYQRRCPDGSCVYSEGTCPGECDYTTQKRCRDGTCVYTGSRCVEDPCPSYRPNRCSSTSNQCYSEGDRCDGYNDCSNGRDERYCDNDDDDYGGGSSMPWWPFVIGVSVLGFTIFCCFICCRSNQKPATTTVVTGEQSRLTGQPAVVAGARPTPQVGYAPQTQTTVINGSSNQGNARTAPSAPPPDNEQVTDSLLAPPPSYDEAITAQYAPSAPPAPPKYHDAISDMNIDSRV